MIGLVLAFAWACHASAPGVSFDTDVGSDAESDETPPRPEDSDRPDSDGAGFTAHVEPGAPRWDEDLRCVVDGLPAETPAMITWTALGVTQGPMTDGVRPGDTVPHLRQAGGERWSCTVAVGAAVATSPEVRIEPPVSMVEVAGGTFYYPEVFLEHPVTLTRTYLLATTEMSRVRWEQWAPPAPMLISWMTYTPEMPVTGIDWHAMMAVAARLSVLDGLAPCGTCAEVDGAPRCELPPDPYACEGYRLPTGAEWRFACGERGRHTDPVPAGGIPQAEPNYSGPDPVPLVGPHAPPGSVLSDYCTYLNSFRKPHVAVDQAALPNALGLIGMCGNASEMTLDNAAYRPGVLPVDPFEVDWEEAYAPGGSVQSDADSVGCRNMREGLRSDTDSTLRLARTLIPRAP